MRLISFEGFSLEKYGKTWKNLLFFRADMAGLGSLGSLDESIYLRLITRLGLLQIWYLEMRNIDPVMIDFLSRLGTGDKIFHVFNICVVILSDSVHSLNVQNLKVFVMGYMQPFFPLIFGCLLVICLFLIYYK